MYWTRPQIRQQSAGQERIKFTGINAFYSKILVKKLFRNKILIYFSKKITQPFMAKYSDFRQLLRSIFLSKPLKNQNNIITKQIYGLLKTDFKKQKNVYVWWFLSAMVPKKGYFCPVFVQCGNRSPAAEFFFLSKTV